jgi:hypothetical protein
MGLVRSLCAILRLAPWAVACAWGSDIATQSLDVNPLSVFSSASENQSSGARHWTLVGAPSLALEKQSGDCCGYVPVASRNDSLSHVGIQIEASRGFTVDISVYSNLGDFVDRLVFSVPQSQFERLAPGSKSNTRLLRVLWDNRTESGRLAATGAYVLKTRVSLNPTAAAAALTRTDYRIVALLRAL